MTEWWDEKALGALNDDEWEALCDGCAKCCLHKFEDEESGQVYYTNLRCGHLDEQTCRCRDYAERSRLVPNCVALRPAGRDNFGWLPQTCAYRLRAQGELLPDWHPLVSGTMDAMHQAGISIRGRSISDEHVHPDEYEEHIVRWLE